MATGDLPPEQLIRRWLDKHGPVNIGMGALAQSWKLESIEAADRREIAVALEAAGIVVDPPLEAAGRKDKLSLSLAEPEPEPEPKPEPAPAPEPEPEPELAAEATAEPPPAPSPPAAPGPRARPSRKAPLKRLRHLLPDKGRHRPATPPVAAAHEAPASQPPEPEVEPELPPGIEPNYEPGPEPEIEPAPEPPPEPEIPPAPEPPPQPEIEPAPEPPPEPEIEPAPEPPPEPEIEPAEPEVEVEPEPASPPRRTRRRPRTRAKRHRQPRRRPRREPAVRSRPDKGPRPEFPLAIRLVPIALALMVFGSLGPWAKNILVTDYGIDRGGYVVLAIAAVAGVLLVLHARTGKRSPLPLLAALLATAAVVVVAADFRELVDDQFVGPAWGLYAAFVGSAALVALSMSLLTKRH